MRGGERSREGVVDIGRSEKVLEIGSSDCCFVVASQSAAKPKVKKSVR